MEGLNDLFVQNTSGIPYISRCYGGNFCKLQPDHALVTGFFAAINSFKGEFGQKELNNVLYEEINLSFASNEDLLVVFNLDRKADENQFKDLANKISKKFIETFPEYNSGKSLPAKKVDEFSQWVDDLTATKAMQYITHVIHSDIYNRYDM